MIIVRTRRTNILAFTSQGYPITVIERQQLLRVLFDGLKDKSRVSVDKKVITIDHTSNGVTAKCSDGSSYSAGIAMGTDGVHSITRREMWQYIEKK
jgi:FAD dependent monooxygenase